MTAKQYAAYYTKPEKSYKFIRGGNINESGNEGLYKDYFLWNQNGFNNALYDHFGCADWDYKEFKKYSPKQYARHLARDNYPATYPCYMRIWCYHTFEGGRLFAEFVY